MNKEELSRRLQLVEMDLQQTTANYNALLGAKSEINFWIKSLEQQEQASACVELKEMRDEDVKESQDVEEIAEEVL